MSMLLGIFGGRYFSGRDPPCVDRWVGPVIGLEVKGACSSIARGGEPAHDATRWHHDFRGWGVAFCLPLGFRMGGWVG